MKFILILLFINLLAAILFIYDKRAAMQGRWRIPEASFFLLGLLGAAPLLMILIRTIRHKNRKGRFYSRIILILVLQLGALPLLLLFAPFEFACILHKLSDSPCYVVLSNGEREYYD